MDQLAANSEQCAVPIERDFQIFKLMYDVKDENIKNSADVLLFGGGVLTRLWLLLYDLIVLTKACFDAIAWIS